MTLATLIQAGYFAAMAIGVSVFWVYRNRLASTGRPKLLALCNSLGGATAAAIGAVALFQATADAAAAVSAADMAAAAQDFGVSQAVLALIGALIGAVCFALSISACAKMQGWMDKVHRFRGQQLVNLLLLMMAVALGILTCFQLDARLILAFFLVCLVFGMSLSASVSGAHLPRVLPLCTAFTGLALAFEGYAMHSPALIIAGLTMGAWGASLARRRGKA